jgi:steroid 5-alpha reductase family enzyme
VFSLPIYADGFPVVAGLSLGTWLLSLRLGNVSIVDSLWSLLFLALAATYAWAAPAVGDRGHLIGALVAVWALRLSFYITRRNWGHGEDRRYQAIRARNQPGFAFKSLYLVFGLQAALAWVISLPILGATLSSAPLGWVDGLGAAAWMVGFAFEAGGDWQLARFKSDPANADRVMDRGFWGLTRHPNYFGEFAMWWGFFLIAAAGGAWWSFPGPLLMSFLLLKVSGVTLLEKDIGERRPKYAEYVRRTNAFFPGPRR